MITADMQQAIDNLIPTIGDSEAVLIQRSARDNSLTVRVFRKALTESDYDKINRSVNKRIQMRAARRQYNDGPVKLLVKD